MGMKRNSSRSGEARASFYRVVLEGLAACIFSLLITASGPTLSAEDESERVSSLQKWIDLLPPELRPVTETLPDAKNAWPVWIQAFKKLALLKREEDRELVKEIARGQRPFPGGGSGEALEKWLEDNEAALDLIDRGAALGRLRAPEGDKVEIGGAEVPAGRLEMEAANLFALGLARHLKDGKVGKALADLERFSRFAGLAGRPSSSFFSGLSIRSQVLLWIREAATHPRAGAADLRALLAPLSRLQDPVEGYRQFLRSPGLLKALFTWINLRMLPEPLRPRWRHRLGMIGCGIFYLGLSILVFLEKQLPFLRELFGA